MEVKDIDCSLHISTTTISGGAYTVPASPAGPLTQVVGLGSSYAFTSMAAACPLNSYALKNSADGTAYTGSLLTFSTSTGELKVDTNVAGSAAVYIDVNSISFTKSTNQITVSVSCTDPTLSSPPALIEKAVPLTPAAAKEDALTITDYITVNS